MRALIDIRYRTRSGAARSLENTTRAIIKDPNSRHDVWVLKWHDQHYQWLDPDKTISVFKGSIARQLIWDEFVLPRLLSRHEVDIYHAMKALGPMVMRSKRVLVSRSITLPYQGEFPAPFAVRLYWNVFGSWMYRRADAVHALSNFLRLFLIEAVGVDPSRIHVAHNGIDEEFQRLSQGNSAVQGALCNPYLLLVGNIAPVKNTLTAVRAFSAVADKLPRHKLVIAGRHNGPYADQVTRAVSDAGLRDRVVFEGYCDDRKLVDLYSNATLLLFPSLTEGCPNSLLEAMTCGLPSIASNRGGIPEVGGKATVLIDDPMDVDAWASQILALLSDENKLASMRRGAVAQASRYNWENTAREVLCIYDTLGGLNDGH